MSHGYTKRPQDNNNHNEFCGIKDGECFICKESTCSLGANPSMWPIYLPHIDGQTKHRFYHIKCLYPLLTKFGKDNSGMAANEEFRLDRIEVYGGLAGKEMKHMYTLRPHGDKST